MNANIFNNTHELETLKILNDHFDKDTISSLNIDALINISELEIEYLNLVNDMTKYAHQNPPNGLHLYIHNEDYIKKKTY